MFVLKLPAFENKQNIVYGNGPSGEILTKKEPIRTLEFTWRLLCYMIIAHKNKSL